MAWIERQQPEGDEVFLDHVGWFVADLDKATAQLKRLGFAVSDENVHMNRAPDGSQSPSGTVNRLATPGLGYLEFLGARGDTPLARQHAAQLARYEGLHLMAFSSADVPGEAPRLAAEGFRPLDPVDMRRSIETPDGPAEARFSVLRVPPDAMPEGRMQWCGHKTPEHVWKPGETTQPNGVEALTGALWIVDDVDEALERYSRFLRKPALRRRPGLGAIALDRGALLFATPAGANALAASPPTRPFGALVSLKVADLAETCRALQDVAPVARIDGGALVDDGLGARLLLHQGQSPLERL